MSDVDVAVVGAGPAGAAAAYHLARAGLRVMLMDRASFPRPKVCGDGLTPAALAEMESLGVLPELTSAFPIESLLTVDLTDGRELRAPVPSLTGSSMGMVVPRFELDDALRRAAERAGARFAPRTSVRELLRSRRSVIGVEADSAQGATTCRAAVTVIAGGSVGRLAGALRPEGGARALGVAVRQYVRLKAPLEAAFRIYVPLVGAASALCGYGWVFPVRADLANVGVGYLLPPSGSRPPMRQVFSEFLAALSRVEPRIATSDRCGRPQGGLIDASLSLREYLVGGALLVGDAAGAANPFTGEGIAQALTTGRLAAEAIVDHLDRGSSLETAYRDRLAAHFPHRDMWITWARWLSERGGIRSREFLEMIAAPTSCFLRGVRSLVLERRVDERRGGNTPGAALDRNDREADGMWAEVGQALQQRHPLLAKLLVDARADLGVDVDPVLEAYARASAGGGEDLRLPVALLALMGLLARDAVDERGREGMSARTSWAVNAVSLGAADLLVAECFAALSTVSSPRSQAFARAARLLFGEAFGQAEKAASVPCVSSRLLSLATQLGRGATGLHPTPRHMRPSPADVPHLRLG